jgi:cyclophilin family peptidyl-prolyl cis-trans isomerase/HEAT repeat protein
MPRRRLAAGLAFLLAACGSSREKPEVQVEATVLSGARGAPIEIVTSRELEEVARLEDARSLGNGRLCELLASDRDVRVRVSAATALGRFPFPQFGPEVTVALVHALEDPELDVRLAAAFALGVRADPDCAGTLLAYRNDPEPRMRARLVEAASKLADPGIHTQLILSLRDADLSVRMEAAVGAARWSTATSDAGEVDRALLDALHPYRITRETASKSAVEAELVWRILWVLGRRKAELGRGPFQEYASSEVTLERLFALRGLGQLTPDVPSVRAALAALDGANAARDWRIAYEAVAALGRFGAAERSTLDKKTRELLADKAPLEALKKATEHSSPHVRAGAMEALGSFGDDREVLALLQRGRLDLSAGVRAAALRARVRLADPDDAFDALRRAARDEDPVLRAAAADAAGAWRDERAADILLELARDPSLFVSTRAVEQLGQHSSDAVRAELHAFLEHADNGMRLAAVLALKAMPAPDDLAALVQAATSSRGDGSAEVAFNALQALAAIGTSEALAAVERARSDPRPYVRAVARKIVPGVSGSAPGSEELGASPSSEVPTPGKDYPAWRFNPMVELTTSRGTMVFELFPAEAPLHVHNFLQLIEHGHYNELTFHRVVPDFVVQGGDYRGDGNGAKPYQGEALRAEFTPRKTTRGSLGMPRNDDPDSGGSQFFVTHLPTPHLDGRYTIFGELRTGGAVLDQLEVGDRILSARLLR